MKFTITTRSATLAAMVVSGDTQTLFTANADHYLDGNNNGITYEKQDPNSQGLISVPQAERAQ